MDDAAGQTTPAQVDRLVDHLPEELLDTVLKHCSLETLARICCLSHRLARVAFGFAESSAQLGLFCCLSSATRERSQQVTVITDGTAKLQALREKRKVGNYRGSAEMWFLSKLKDLPRVVVAVHVGEELMKFVDAAETECVRAEAVSVLGWLGRNYASSLATFSLKRDMAARFGNAVLCLLHDSCPEVQLAAIRGLVRHLCLLDYVGALEPLVDDVVDDAQSDVSDAAAHTLLSLLPLVGAPSSHGGSASSNSALGSAFRTKGVHNGPDGDELSLADRAHLRVASYRLGERVA